jgi:hypothetical protein
MMQKHEPLQRETKQNKKNGYECFRKYKQKTIRDRIENEILEEI